NINKISPLGKTTYRSKEIRDKKDRLKKIEYNTRIYGLITVDYWKLYKTLTYKNYSSNSLDSVAKREIGEGKIDYISESTKTDNTIFDLNSLADNDWETFIKYNMKDVIIMKMLDDKIGFMDNSWLLAMIANCEYFKIFSTIRFWDSSIYSSLRNENIVIDADRKQTARKYIGGYCKNSETEGLIPNIYKWHVSYDVDSEYPTASIGANISPETRLVWTNDNKEKYRELYEYWLDMIEKYELPIKEITGEKYNNTNEKKILAFMVYPNKDYKKFVKLLHKYNLTYTPNGKFFKRDKQGFLPKIFQHDFDFRLHLKKLLKETDDEAYFMQLKRLEQNIKIRLNSGYGYTGNKYSRYCDVDNIAESIVTFGRIEIQTISYYISKYIYKKWGKLYDKEKIKFENISTYNDTDSTYLNINPIVQDIISKNKTDWENMDLHDFTRKYILPITDVELQNVINKILKRIYTCCNGYVDYFGMKREVVADKCVFVGAKHYAMRKLFDGGKQISKEKELKVNGLEIIKSTTPGILRDRMMKFVSFILDEDFKSLRKEMREVKNDLLNKFGIDEIAKNTSISVSIDEYMDDYGHPKKGTPQHIKASINYNNYVESNNISLPEINTDDKIKLIYLKTPNPVGTDVNCIAYKNEFPNDKKFKELEKYIDRNKMFDVLVNSNVDNIVEKIGMKIDLNKTALF
ncbi:MAG: DNA polymerase domain-containing protein, partial [Nanoarchaeota archaeon]